MKKETKIKIGLANSISLKGNKNHYKHGMSETKIYRTLSLMKNRCFNKDSSDYKDYGGRKITICKRWLGENGFINFYEDMGECPNGKSIDRINNNGNYEPNNCRWATPREQANNRKSNHFITFNNRTQTIAQWAIELEIPYNTLWNRVNNYKLTKKYDRIFRKRIRSSSICVKLPKTS